MGFDALRDNTKLVALLLDQSPSLLEGFLRSVALHLVRIGRRIGIAGLGIAAVAGDRPRADGDAGYQCHSHNVFHRAPPLRN